MLNVQDIGQNPKGLALALALILKSEFVQFWVQPGESWAFFLPQSYNIFTLYIP